MRSQFRTRGIVLSRTDFGEADRYVQFLTPEFGIISALAKSARKSKRRYAGGMDLFCHDEIFLRGDPSKTPYLTELNVLNSFQGLRADLDKIFYAGKLVQWIRKSVQPGQSHRVLYSLLGQTLALINNCNEGTERLEILSLLFKFKLMHMLGMEPRMSHCMHCEQVVEGRAWFHMVEGGFLCLDCFGVKPEINLTELRNSDLKLMANAARYRFKEWSDLSLEMSSVKKVNHLITQFATYHSQVELPI